MKKKEYTQPSIEVMNINTPNIICTSTMSLDFGDPEEEDLIDTDGYIWGQ